MKWQQWKKKDNMERFRESNQQTRRLGEDMQSTTQINYRRNICNLII